jgi:RNA polymerase sigma factor (sigma-70 family)
MMSQPKEPLSRAIPTDLAGRSRRIVSEDHLELARPYLGEIGQLETLTPEQEIELAKAVEGYTGAMRREILGIPLAARLLVSHWCELRSANRVTATLSALPPDRRPPDASDRINALLQRVARLLDRRDKLWGLGDAPPSAAKLARIDREMQRALLEADLSPPVYDDLLGKLRAREALFASDSPSPSTLTSEQEIGLPPAEFRERMERIRAVERSLQEVRNELIRRNLRLVIKVARDFRGRGVPFPDLVQEGSLGVLHAVGKFDYHLGFKFSTYVVWWIRQAMIRAIQKQSRTVRLPSHVYDRSIRFRRTHWRLFSTLGRAPTSRELAEALEIDESQVDNLMQIDQQTASLDAPVRQAESESLGDLLEDPASRNPVDELDQERLNRAVETLLVNLSPREQEVLRGRFGMNGEEELTLQGIADRLGLSRERIRQIQAGALKKLRARSSRVPELESLVGGARPSRRLRGCAVAGRSDSR